MKPNISVEQSPAEKPEIKDDALTAPEPDQVVAQPKEPELPPPPEFEDKACPAHRYWRQILYMAIGVILALLMIYWGFWRTVLLMLLAWCGLLIAERQEGRRPLKKVKEWFKKHPPFVK